jgi:hypothetical protein
MNELEAHQLIEEAEKYIGKPIILNPFSQSTFKRVKINCAYSGRYLLMDELSTKIKGSEGRNVIVTAYMNIIDEKRKSFSYHLKSMIEKYKEVYPNL